MAYTKYPKRKTYKKRRYTKKGGISNMTVGQIATKAYAGFKMIKGLVNSELYCKDQNPLIDVAQTNLGKVTPLHNLTIGDSASERTGNSILLKNVYLKVRLSWSTTNGNQFKYWLIHDKQQQSDTPPTFGDIFNSRDVLSMRNRDTLDRFSVLKQGLITQDSDRTVVDLSIYHEFAQHHVKWNGPNPTDIQKGGIYLVTVAANSVSPVVFLCDSRIQYHDN